MIKKKLVTVLASVCLMIGLAACGGNEEATPELEENEPVAMVNGQPISQQSLAFQYEQVKLSYQQMGLEINEETEAQIKLHVLDQLVNSTLITQAAVEEGFEASQDEIQAQLDLFIEEYGTEEEFVEVLEMNNFTLASFSDEIKSQITINKYIENKIAEPVITSSEVEERYEQYKQQTENMPELEEVYAQLEAEIRDEKNQASIGELVDQLKATSEINILI
ncbi:hypothetical protein DS745_20625 [Anaerobacillus alkaliphilus]|uniref:Peptidylprolyl isomerase n=1 Tax=Anaerobacillus alkaliphilus TaxID=1548597 RepID=A0A4Q0VKW9_9BACI|nr:SurA N-terminal domain-containing protein [Anaerobacillus alkaliphilus]RXI96151.1 hypothetical protein DS745_20625 [Anaerobacillus alkaliphilus]